jgi:aspartate/methionine/tyrosine aminotransferase
MVLEKLDDSADLVTVPRADGAFYFLLRVHKDTNPMGLVKQLIEKHKVAVIPGMTFGMEDRCYLRIAYGALQKETATEGIGRLVEGLGRILAV